MSTNIGIVVSESIYNHSAEVYVGVSSVVLFVQNCNDRDGVGTKILLDKPKLRLLIEMLETAEQAKGWDSE